MKELFKQIILPLWNHFIFFSSLIKNIILQLNTITKNILWNYQYIHSKPKAVPEMQTLQLKTENATELVSIIQVNHDQYSLETRYCLLILP